MSSQFINGASFAISRQRALPVAISDISNADPAVALSANPPPNGSILTLTSGWADLTDAIVRSAGLVVGVSFQLEGVDTGDVNRYPAGEGAGAFVVHSDFVGMSQMRDFTVAGGEQQYFQYKYVEDKAQRQRQKPTFKNPMTMTMVLDYDPDLPWYDALVELDAAKEPVVLRETLPNGDLLLFYGYISFNKVPTHTVDENMTVTATFSLLSDPIRYAG